MLLLSESFVVLERIDRDHEILRVVFLDHIPVFRQRLAFDRAAARVGFWEPGQDDGFFALEVGQRVRFAVGCRQLEIRRFFPDFQLIRTRERGQRAACDEHERQQLKRFPH